jgi:hypothetical protein
LRRWVAADQDPATFWAITPREVTVILEGADARARADLKMAQQIAYSTAVLMMIGAHNPKKFPAFEKAFPESAVRRLQAPDEIYAAFAEWAEAARAATPEQS